MRPYRRRRSTRIWLWLVALVALGSFALFQNGTRLEAQRLAGPNAYYRNCDAARAAGVAPIYMGEPGYREALDGDYDGIACEPRR